MRSRLNITRPDVLVKRAEDYPCTHLLTSSLISSDVSLPSDALMFSTCSLVRFSVFRIEALYSSCSSGWLAHTKVFGEVVGHVDETDERFGHAARTVMIGDCIHHFRLRLGVEHE